MKPEVAIVGAGYVGLPLGRCFAEAGIPVVLVDIDAERVEAINRGESHVEDVPSQTLAALLEAETLSATTSYDAVRDTDAIIVALPTPLSANREPDLAIVMSAAREVGRRLRPGQLVSLESTTYRARRGRRCCRFSPAAVSKWARTSISPSRRSG